MNQDNVVCYTLTFNITNGHDYDMITIMICYESCVSLCIKIRLWSYTVDDLRISPIVRFRIVSWISYAQDLMRLAFL